MFKKIISATFVIIMIVVPCSFAFSDTKGHWAESSIQKLADLKVLNGYEDGKFKPDDNMTRAEFITVINRLLNNSQETQRFIPDIDSKKWYYSEIRKAIASGIITGDEDGYTNPESYITREEAVVIMERAFCSGMKGNFLSQFQDREEVADWAKSAMSEFVVREVIQGYEDETIRPKSNITRGEVVTILDRLFKEIITSGKYKKDVNGDLLVTGSEVTLSNLTINGNLILTEGVNGTIKLSNIKVMKNIILRSEVALKGSQIIVHGDIIERYQKAEDETFSYHNKDYGIRFQTPDYATIVETSGDNSQINYKTKDLITITFSKYENLHFKTISKVVEEQKSKYTNLFITEESGKLGSYPYTLLKDENDIYLFIIKRDDIVYSMQLYNLTNINLVDNLLNTIDFTSGTKVHEHFEKLYRNTDLDLSFRYLDYIGVDDSYNSKVMFEGDCYFKLFIQVNAIRDLAEYNLNDLKSVLSLITVDDGKLLESKISKINDFDTIEFVVKDGSKIKKTVYIPYGKMLYTFIFIGEEGTFYSIGNELFEETLKSLKIGK